jgi:MFS transporter, OFA family, oxalate/formate antiporter
MLYTAKGAAALLVPLGNVLTAATGSWTAIFVVATVLNLVAATLALGALKPMRIRAMAKQRLTPNPDTFGTSAPSH